MKRFQLLLCLIYSLTVCKAQITQIDIADNFTIDRIYIGLNTKTTIDVSDSKNSNLNTLQSGLLISHYLHSKVRLRSFGAMRFKNNQEIKSFSEFQLIYKPVKSFHIALGVMATPTTELRPNPTTWQSQAENNAQSKIIGGRTGIKLKYQIDKKTALMYGFFKHEQGPAHHIKISYHSISFASYWENEGFFSAIDFSSNRFDMVATYKKDSELAISSFYKTHIHYHFFIEAEHHFSSKKLIRSNIGLRRYFHSKKVPIKGFFSMHFDYSYDKLIYAGFMIHV